MAKNVVNGGVIMKTKEENSKKSSEKDISERLLKWQQERGRVRSNRLPWEPSRLSNQRQRTEIVQGKENVNPNVTKTTKNKIVHVRDKTVSAPPGNKRLHDMNGIVPVLSKKSKMESKKNVSIKPDEVLKSEPRVDLQEIAAEMEKMKIPRYKTEHWRAARRAHYSERVRQMMNNRRHTLGILPKKNENQLAIAEKICKTGVKSNMRNKLSIDLNSFKKPLEPKKLANAKISHPPVSSCNSKTSAFPTNIKCSKKISRAKSEVIAPTPRSDKAACVQRSLSTANVRNKSISSNIGVKNQKFSKPKTLDIKQKTPPKIKLKSPKSSTKKFSGIPSRYLQQKVPLMLKDNVKVANRQILSKKLPIVSSNGNDLAKCTRQSKTLIKVSPKNFVKKSFTQQKNSDKKIKAGIRQNTRETAITKQHKGCKENKTSEIANNLNRTFEKEEESPNKSVSFYIPFETKTPKNPKNIDLKDHRRTIAHFRHMRCFDNETTPTINRKHLRMSLDHSTPKGESEPLKYFCVKTEPKRRSCPVFDVKWKTPFKTNVGNMECINNDIDEIDEILNDFLNLLDENHPYEEISEKLDHLCENKPEIRKMASYWVCRAQVAALSDNFNEATRMLELAVKYNAEPLHELKECLEKLKQKFDTNSSRSYVTNAELNGSFITDSSVVKFFVTTPHKRISDFKMYTVTPVRRSLRLVQVCNKINPEMELPACVDSVEGLPLDIHRNLLYKPNPAMTSWDIDVEYLTIDDKVDES